MGQPLINEADTYCLSHGVDQWSYSGYSHQVQHAMIDGEMNGRFWVFSYCTGDQHSIYSFTDNNCRPGSILGEQIFKIFP